MPGFKCAAKDAFDKRHENADLIVAALQWEQIKEYV